MVEEKKKSALEKFVSTYFSNLGKLALVNLIFAVPACVAVAACYLICRYLVPQATTFILPLSIIFASPFFAGVVVLCRSILFDSDTDNLLKRFMSAVKENFKAFIIHGVITYVAVVGCYHGILIYNQLAKAMGFLYVMLIISVLLALFVLFFLYSIYMMSAFFDLGIKNVYKNGLLMTFGELKNNFLATFGMVGYLLVVSLPVMLFLALAYLWGPVPTAIVIAVYVIAAFVFLVPSGLTSIMVYVIYPDMKRVISGEARNTIEAMRKEEEIMAEIKAEESADDTIDISIEDLEKNADEYIFYKGKMMKKSALISKLKESEDV